MIGRKDFALCPKWEKCSAPVCPLDPDWKKRTFISEDACCFYLQEAAKSGAKARFALHGHGKLFDAIADIGPAIITRHRIIAGRVERATVTGRRMNLTPPWAKKDGR